MSGRSEQYRQGYRAAMRDCVTWLHARAKSMNDGHAVQILNSAAFSLGCEIRDHKAGQDFADRSMAGMALEEYEAVGGVTLEDMKEEIALSPTPTERET